MTDESRSPRKDRFYDVDRVKELLKKQSLQQPPHVLIRVTRRAIRSLDSMTGFFVVLGGISIVYVAALAVLVGSLYGAVGFWGVFGVTITVLSVYVDRKVGKSIQFGDYSVIRRGLATAVGFVLVIGALYLLIFFTGLLPS